MLMWPQGASFPNMLAPNSFPTEDPEIVTAESSRNSHSIFYYLSNS